MAYKAHPILGKIVWLAPQLPIFYAAKAGWDLCKSWWWRCRVCWWRLCGSALISWYLDFSISWFFGFLVSLFPCFFFLGVGEDVECVDGACVDQPWFLLNDLPAPKMPTCIHYWSGIHETTVTMMLMTRMSKRIAMMTMMTIQRRERGQWWQWWWQWWRGEGAN